MSTTIDLMEAEAKSADVSAAIAAGNRRIRELEQEVCHAQDDTDRVDKLRVAAEKRLAAKCEEYDAYAQATEARLRTLQNEQDISQMIDFNDPEVWDHDKADGLRHWEMELVIDPALAGIEALLRGGNYPVEGLRDLIAEPVTIKVQYTTTDKGRGAA